MNSQKPQNESESQGISEQEEMLPAWLLDAAVEADSTFLDLAAGKNINDS